MLLKSIDQKKITAYITNVQPKGNEYVALQTYLAKITQSNLDCYEVPDSNIRKVAINLERLRWANIAGNVYVHINIPSYALKYHQNDSVYLFKVIVGKIATPTPTLNSQINYFTTAPEWRVPQKIFRRELLPKALHNSSYLENSHLGIYDKKDNYVAIDKATLQVIAQHPENYYARQSSGCDNALGLLVFRFLNVFEIYLHDTPEQQLFQKDARAFSHGCIRVEQAEKLASLFLKFDNAESAIGRLHKAVTAYQTKTFNLKKAIPIKITYLTCEIRNGELVRYKDIYDLDNSLEMALYIGDKKFVDNAVRDNIERTKLNTTNN